MWDWNNQENIRQKSLFFSNTEFWQKWRYMSNSNTVDCKNQRYFGSSKNYENTVISREFRQLKDIILFGQLWDWPTLTQVFLLGYLEAHTRKHLFWSFWSPSTASVQILYLLGKTLGVKKALAAISFQLAPDWPAKC